MERTSGYLGISFLPLRRFEGLVDLQAEVVAGGLELQTHRRHSVFEGIEQRARLPSPIVHLIHSFLPCALAARGSSPSDASLTVR